MKTIHVKITLIALIIVFFTIGCKKDYGPSKPTFWPNIVINGSSFVAVPVGSAYEDSGAVVTINSEPVPYETESNVDTSTTGVYSVVYTAVNEDGISASQTRTVIVVDTAAANDDLSGTYQRSTNTPASVWTKDPDRPYTYIANNPGGVANNPPFNVLFSIYNVEPGIVMVPLQQSGGLEPFYCTQSLGGSEKIPFNVGGAVGTTAYAWVVNGANFGTGLRTFKKI